MTRTAAAIDRWKTPDDFRQWLSRRFDRLVEATLQDPSASIEAFPITTPDLTAALVSEHFAPVRAWATVWQETAATEPDLEMTYTDWSTRNFGRVRIPKLAQLTSVEGAARFIGRSHELTSARQRYNVIVAMNVRFVRLAAHWPAIVAMNGDDFSVLCRFLQEVATLVLTRMRLREVPCAGMHTKFLEQHRGLLAPVMAALEVPANPDAKSWAGRLGFVEDDTRLFEVRDLDGNLLPFPHFAVPAKQLAECPVKAGVVSALHGIVVVENQATFRALPQIAGVIAIFGRGDAVRSVGTPTWLATRPLLYSGDLDHAGFQMVAGLRRHGFQRLETALMDAETAESLRQYWVKDSSRPGSGRAYDGLTEQEAAAQRLMATGPWRLEQERIPFDIWIDGLRRWRQAQHR